MKLKSTNTVKMVEADRCTVSCACARNYDSGNIILEGGKHFMLNSDWPLL